MRHQRGVTLSGLLVSCVVIIFVALLGFKLFTPYTEYFSIKKTFKSIAANPEVKNGGKREMTQVWERYATIERITAMSPVRSTILGRRPWNADRKYSRL